MRTQHSHGWSHGPDHGQGLDHGHGPDQGHGLDHGHGPDHGHGLDHGQDHCHGLEEGCHLLLMLRLAP